MPCRSGAKKATIIASSGGTNAKGAHIVTPKSILLCRDHDSTLYEQLAMDTVRIKFNAIWDCTATDVLLPTGLVFEHVQFDPAIIRNWLRHNEANMGGLLFPGTYLDVDSQHPRIRILKQNPTDAESATMRADITLHIFRRQVGEASELQPFDPAVWSPEAYDMWRLMHAETAPALEEECDYRAGTCKKKLPRGACLLFRRMMHTHFADCGWVFSDKIWRGFGLGRMMMVPSSGHEIASFMHRLLVGMFLQYNASDEPPPPASLPPLYNPATMGSGQRVCAQCLAFRLGSGLMMRCPCREVYYCSKECQLKDWKVHRTVCGAGGGKQVAKGGGRS